MSFKGDFIKGRWQLPSADHQWQVVSPADHQDVIVQASSSVASAELAAVEARKAYLKVWRKSSLEQRIKCLKKLAEIYKAEEDQIAKVICREVGKPFWEAKMEASLLAGKIHVTLSSSMKLIEDQEMSLGKSMKGCIHYRPKGVLAIMGPFNFPAHLPNAHFIPALIAGNTLIFKPSPRTPYTGQLLTEMIHKAGFPEGVFNLVQGGDKESQALLKHEAVDGILFTGSYEVGRSIQKTLLDFPSKSLALEMGGKNASVVWKDADLDKASYDCVVGSFITSGQRCSSSSLIFVHPEVYESFKQKMLAWVKRIQVGYPFEDMFYGSLISAEAVQLYFEAAESAQRHGGHILSKPSQVKASRKGHYVAPCVVEMPFKFTKYHEREYFCPHTALHSSDSLEDICEFVNRTDYGLSSSIFTHSESVYQEFRSLLKVGLCNLNSSTVGASGKLPFGGLGKSGNDHPSGHFAVNYCTTPVSCVMDRQDFSENSVYQGFKV